MTDITSRLIDFSLALKYEDLPPEIIERAKHGVLDLLGVALAGAAEASSHMLHKVFVTAQHSGAATVLGRDECVSPVNAALLNGYAAQALDFDDSHHAAVVHMSACVLPAALAIAETRGCSGKDLLAAYVAGYEVGCRLGRIARVGRQLSRRGLHATGILGHFGAFAAAGKLMQLDSSQMQRGFGIAAGQASGVMRSFGTMCKPMNAANAAQHAVLAAKLAQQDYSGPQEIFDGEQNIFSVCGVETDTQQFQWPPLAPYEIASATFKIYACAGWRNPVMEAAIELATRHELRADNIVKVEIHACTEQVRLPNYTQPRCAAEAKFSTEHVAAAGLMDGAGGVDQFTEQRAMDPALASLRNKVTVAADPELTPHQIRFAVHTADGHLYTHFIAAQKGDPRNPLTVDELRAKFFGNAHIVLSKPPAQDLCAMVLNLEVLPDIAALLRLCRAS